MNSTQLLGSLFVLAIPVIALIVFVGIIGFVIKDAHKNDGSLAWLLLCVLFGNFGLSVYLFATKRNGWGGFWLVVYPSILVIAFLSGISFIENAGIPEEELYP